MSRCTDAQKKKVYPYIGFDLSVEIFALAMVDKVICDLAYCFRFL